VQRLRGPRPIGDLTTGGRRPVDFLPKSGTPPLWDRGFWATATQHRESELLVARERVRDVDATAFAQDFFPLRVS
jgi:hypothetical protein